MPAVHSRDLVVPEAWEGPGGEIHVNEIAARDMPYGAPIVSGITLMIRCLAEHVPTVMPPHTVEWSFDGALLVADDYTVDYRGDLQGAGLEVSVESRGQPIGGGRVHYREGPLTAPPATPVPGLHDSTGRTLVVGDRELWDWWMSQSCVGVGEGDPNAIPWMMVVSLAGGLLGRVDPIDMDHADVLNRAMSWRFHRPTQIGETLRARFGAMSERRSASRPQFGVWTGEVFMTSETRHDVVATADWTLMFETTTDGTGQPPA